MSPSNNRPPKKKPGEIETNPLRTLELSTEDWAEVAHGIGLFNAGKFWHAHEAWELVWQRQAEDERLFFQGLIQLAAAYHHLTKKRVRTGYINNLKKSGTILQVFAPEYLGIEVGPLLAAIAAGIEASNGTEDALPTEREVRLIPKIGFRHPYDPDLVAAVKSATADVDFCEGVALFNDGFHWEAHERWEEAMRNAEGDAKSFLQGFVQAAAALSFLASGKRENAGYLFVKSVDNLRRFGGLNCGVELLPLVEWMAGAVSPDDSGKPVAVAPALPLPAIGMPGRERAPGSGADGAMSATG
jgi:predicted metal-dependent hydrolase